MQNVSAAEEFKKLLDTSDILLGEQGCPWDREQTLVSMRASILEEACEVIEAIDEGNDADLIEELGDLLYNIIFFCKLGEKENRFTSVEPIRQIYQKLIARHPHVFAGKHIANIDEVISQWEQLKKVEKSHRESVMDGIPKGLPALARAYKIVGKIKKALNEQKEAKNLFQNEEELGALLWSIVQQAKEQNINPETALRKYIAHQEESFRSWERLQS